MRKKLIKMSLHKKSFNGRNEYLTKNPNYFINNNSSNYSTFGPDFAINEKIKFRNEINNKSNFSNYVNINNIPKPEIPNLEKHLTNNNITNLSLQSNGINQRYKDDINLIEMQLNFNILKQKMINLSNITLQNNSYNSFNNRYNSINFFTDNNKNIKNNYINNYLNNNNNLANSFQNCNNNFKNERLINNQKRNNIKRKLFDNELSKNNNNIKNNFNHFDRFLIQNKNINYNEYNNRIIKKEGSNQADNSITNKSIEINLENLSYKDSEIISDDELSNLADILINTIKEKKNYSKNENKNDINNKDNKNKIINKKTSIKNNYIITNNSGALNYTPSKNSSDEINAKVDSQKILNKKEFAIFNNNFAIISEKAINNGKIKSISPFRYEEENQLKKEQSPKEGQKLKKTLILDSFLNKEKKEENTISENVINNNNNLTNIHIIADRKNDLNKNKKIEENINKNKNKKSISKNLLNDFNKIKNKQKNKNLSFSYENSRNKINNKIFHKKNNNNIFNIAKKINNSNNKSSHKKVTIDNDILYISYNDNDKPTKINLYKTKNKINKDIKINFRPKNFQNIINNLIIEKKLKSILLNGGDENIVRRDFDDKPFCSMDDAGKIQIKTIKKINTKNSLKNKNIVKRNIDFIKIVEEKVKNNSREKNKNGEKSLGKRNKKDLNKNKNEKNTNNSKSNKGNKCIKKNNDNQVDEINNYIKIDVIKEEEEGREESKHENKIDAKF